MPIVRSNLSAHMYKAGRKKSTNIKMYYICI